MVMLGLGLFYIKEEKEEKRRIKRKRNISLKSYKNRFYNVNEWVTDGNG